jgi:hypothetical protein
MRSYVIERPDGPERGVRVRCPDHDESQEFQPGRRRVAGVRRRRDGFGYRQS